MPVRWRKVVRDASGSRSVGWRSGMALFVLLLTCGTMGAGAWGSGPWTSTIRTQASVAPLLTSDGGGTTNLRGTIPLLPAPRSFSITGSAGLPPPAPIVTGSSIAYPGLYNAAPGGDGRVRISQSAPGAPLVVSVGFRSIASRENGVVGYPELQYGPKPWCARAPCGSPPESALLPLPQPVDRLPSIYPVVDFSAGPGPNGSTGTYDVAYDLWLTRAPSVTSASAGDVEVMVWLDHEGTNLIPGPLAGSAGVATFLQDRWSSASWDDYIQYGDPAASGGHWTVVYLLLDPPVASGTVGVDLTGLLDRAGAELSTHFPASWGIGRATGTANFSSLYLNDLELGSEFRPLVPGGPVAYEWDLSEYCVAVEPASVAWPAIGSGPDCSPAADASVPVASPEWAMATAAGTGAAMWFVVRWNRRPA